MLDQAHERSDDPTQDVDRSVLSHKWAWETLVPALGDGVKILWQRRYVALTILAVAGGMWMFGPTLLFGPTVAADRVLRADFIQTIVASGHVEAPYRVNIGSQIVGVVADIAVAEGQMVKAGDTLIKLDDREALAAVQQNEGLVAQAEARVRQMRELTLPAATEALTQAQATLVNAQQAFDRAQKLAADGYGTRAALETATKALDIARAQVRSAEFQVYTSRPGGSDFVMVETQLAQARANLLLAQSRLGYTIIKAPRDGLLIARDVERGNVVQPSNVLMKLSPTGETQVVVQIDEKNLGLVQVGQTALVSADAFPRDAFPAEVIYINPGIDLQRASVEVKLRVAEPPIYLRQDMTVSVDIQTARHPKVLIAPSAAVHVSASAPPWVLTVVSGRAKRQPVTTGLVSAGRTEITDGVSEGAVLITASNVKPGAKVRAQFPAARQP